MTFRRVVAEIGSCNGDLPLAIDTAQAAIEAGAWMVKGQMYQADTLTTKTAPSYGYESIKEKPTQYEAFSNALSYDEWGEVAEAVDGRFFASVFDLEACQDYPYQFIKLASADITYKALIEAAAATAAHVIMSTGAATRGEINDALRWAETPSRLIGSRPTLLVCTLSYPCPPENANLRRIETLQLSWPDTGYSDHTRGIAASHMALAYGATMVEKHFTIRPGTGGDNDFAIGPNELYDLVNGHGLIVAEAIRDTLAGTSKIGPIPVEEPARQLARRSIHAAEDIEAGVALTPEMLAVVRPADGLPPANFDDTVGKTLAFGVKAGDPITIFHLVVA